jgi:endonuclease/exonuclease/phosphatase (EEP) superfamily protein YafD
MELTRPRAAFSTVLRGLAPGRRTRIVLTVLAAVLLLVAAVGFGAHFWTARHSWTLGVVAFSPYPMLAAPVGALILAVARQWIGLVVALVIVGLCASTQIRLYVAATPAANAHSLVTMTANLHLGEADPSAVVKAVRTHAVDVLMLEELTEEEQTRLIAAGLNDALPFHASDPRYSATGTGLWSRYPLVDVKLRTDFTFAFVTATVRIPGVATEPTVAALHLAGPVPSTTFWQRDIARLPRVLRELAARGIVIVGGDFNATPDVTQFRRLLVDGYRDAAQQAGAGMTRTYPSDRWYPPFIAIDHVLTRVAVGTSADTIEIGNSDHRALLVTVAVPRAA